MLKFDLLLPVALGLAVVVQGGMNRQIARDWGSGGATLFNAVVLLTASYLAGFLFTEMKARFEWAQFRWWFLVPGVLGCFLVAGIPMAIAKMGAVRVFIGLIAAQLLGGLMWDYFMESLPASWPRLAGIALAFIGFLVSTI